jgi:hypothetical protein
MCLHRLFTHPMTGATKPADPMRLFQANLNPPIQNLVSAVRVCARGNNSRKPLNYAVDKA